MAAKGLGSVDSDSNPAWSARTVLHASLTANAAAVLAISSLESLEQGREGEKTPTHTHGPPLQLACRAALLAAVDAQTAWCRQQALLYFFPDKCVCLPTALSVDSLNGGGHAGNFGATNPWAEEQVSLSLSLRF